jgi:hypothetical protein
MIVQIGINLALKNDAHVSTFLKTFELELKKLKIVKKTENAL